MMNRQKGHLRTCSEGHQYYKSSDCPTCPVCEEERKPKTGFLSQISAPARRALESQSIRSLEQLSQYTEQDILKLHGMGPSTIPILKKALTEKDLKFKLSENQNNSSSKY